MSKSERVTAAHSRRIAAVVAECRELGDDAAAWQQHLIAGVRRLTGSTIGFVGLPPPWPWRADAVCPIEIAGDWATAAARDRWTAFGRDCRFDEHPACVPFFTHPDPAAALTRREMIPDADWERSPHVRDRLRPDGLDEGLLARVPAPAVRGVYLLSMVRAVGDPPFRVWAGRVAGRVLGELAPHLGRSLLVTTQPNRAGLSPRALEVLEALLDGDSEKQVALRLGIGRGTVHDHVKLLYRHFGVCSRAELLAYFLRRYRGYTGVSSRS